MSSKYPTIPEVVSHLHATNEPAMAVAVERLLGNFERLMKANAETVEAFNQAMQRLHPPPKVQPTFQPPSESSD